MHSTAKGTLAENIAKDKLISTGYKILETNYKCKLGEIDIIALHENQLVFIEVRSRKDSNFGMPQETVNFKKQQKLKKAALFYLKITNKLDSSCRFDVVSILYKTKVKIKIIKDAF